MLLDTGRLDFDFSGKNKQKKPEKQVKKLWLHSWQKTANTILHEGLQQDI